MNLLASIPARHDDTLLYTTMFYHLTNTCDVALWGVAQLERIQKVLARAGVDQQAKCIEDIPQQERVLVLRADYLYEANVIEKLLKCPRAVLLSSAEKPVAVACCLPARLAAQAIALLSGDQNALMKDETIGRYTPQTLTGAYDPRLRKYDLAHVVNVNIKDRRIIENYLYDKSYKGITDLVTKWWWPAPARAAVRLCAQKNITPNSITSIGWLLTLLTGVAFYHGQFMAGLISAWMMTFLDTVDGKLARVTLQSSRIGHVMDHGLDIIHPPVWYWCWALGAGVSEAAFFGARLAVIDWLWIMLAAYIGGRLFEGLFQLLFNDISIFCWRPLDSYHRLITARRNPCLIVLSLALLLSDLQLGFVCVVIWSVFSTVLLAIRFLSACLARICRGPLQPWVAAVNPDDPHPGLATRLFTGYPAHKTIAPLLAASDR